VDCIVGRSVPEGIPYVVDCVCPITSLVRCCPVQTSRMDLPAAMVGVRSFIEKEVTHLEAEESCRKLTGQIERRWRLETYR
jgi:hypothetical protein